MPVKRATNQRGFTLIEIIIVIAILGILGAIAMPSFNVWRQNAQVRSDARLVMGALQQARVEAITRNESVTMDFDGNGWDIKDEGDDVLKSGGLSSGINLNGATDVTFNSRGIPGSSTSFTVVGNRTFTITITAAGNISLQ